MRTSAIDFAIASTSISWVYWSTNLSGLDALQQDDDAESVEADTE